jgi:hypothetical protein
MKNLSSFLVPLREKIQSIVSNRKILLLICGSAAGFLLLMLLLVISLQMNHTQDEREGASQEPNRLLAPEAIKAEEMFLPSEPDFIPEVMLDREPRSSWTNEDAEQYWVDPLDGNSDAWKNRVFKAVDEMMENIP